MRMRSRLALVLPGVLVLALAYVHESDAQRWLQTPSDGDRRPNFKADRANAFRCVADTEALKKLVEPLSRAEEAAVDATIADAAGACEIRQADAYWQLRTVSSECVGSSSRAAKFETITRVYLDGRIERDQPRELERTQITCTPPVVVGRLPFRYRESVVASKSVLGAYLNSATELESAAALAFGELAETLRRFAAPVDLIDRAHRAAADEVRHAALMGALAAGTGDPVGVASHAPVGYASMLELAKHNMSEGCVRECYGALVALHQAAEAGDPGIRAALAEIASEEISHAQWSHDLADWLDTTLDEAERVEIARVRRQAFADLRAEANRDVDAELVRWAGLPDRGRALLLVSLMEDALAIAH